MVSPSCWTPCQVEEGGCWEGHRFVRAKGRSGLSHFHLCQWQK